jgi:phosphoglycolate phosphatase-like HAD superfamily hydrolase/predicted Rossmann-fold nucleotide-binding protein
MNALVKDPLKAVFFDVDGVLLDSLSPHLKFCRDKASEHKLSIQIPDEQQFRLMLASGFKGSPMAEFLRTAGFPDELIGPIVDDYQKNFAARYPSKKFDGVDQMLEALYGTGVPLGLVTSNVSQNVIPALGKAMAYFQDNLVFFKDRGGDKKATALAKGASNLQVAPETCAFVGDQQSDADAAYDAGLRFLGVTCGWGILGTEGRFKTVNSAAQIAQGIAGAERILLPFNPLRAKLYSVNELWDNYNADMSQNNSLDGKIFKYFKKASKYDPGLDELRMQRSHDAGIEYAIDKFLGIDARSYSDGKPTVMILGSHSTLRKDQLFRDVAHLTYDIARAGFFIATGGGPGLMEAANLGAYMAKSYSKDELDAALDTLRTSLEPAAGDTRKQYELPDYWEVAIKVTDKFPDAGESLGVPTWFYGHEGANRFATHVAKFLSNGLRESKMTSVGVFGAVFCPGGPGTSQEVFTDGAENTYFSFQWLSPMVFFSKKGDEVTTKMLDILKKQTTKDYLDLDMYLQTTDTQEIARFLTAREPQFRERKD